MRVVINSGGVTWSACQMAKPSVSLTHCHVCTTHNCNQCWNGRTHPLCCCPDIPSTHTLREGTLSVCLSVRLLLEPLSIHSPVRCCGPASSALPILTQCMCQAFEKTDKAGGDFVTRLGWQNTGKLGWVSICVRVPTRDVPYSGHYMYRTVVTICTAQWSLYVPPV
jgi:hypothetical protein